MPAKDLHQFWETHPRPHAVFGDYDATQIKLKDPTRLQVAMRLIKALQLTGDFSGKDDAESGVLELWFADEADAKLYAQGVQAKTTGRKPGYASQRAYNFDARVYVKIAKALDPHIQN
jgi:hypothetical protein